LAIRPTNTSELVSAKTPTTERNRIAVEPFNMDFPSAPRREPPENSYVELTI
jgi:hypothetical protein